MGTKHESLLLRLVSRGDRVWVSRGRICIEPLSGQVVPRAWLADKQTSLAAEILEMMGRAAYWYESFSRGQYGNCKRPGVTLQLSDILEGQPVYVVFNASISYVRGAKAGNLLPGKQFRVEERSGFMAFWRSTGLKLPPRRQMFHDYMGNLRRIMLVAAPHETKAGRLVASTLAPLNISPEDISNAIAAYKSPTENQQKTYAEPTAVAYSNSLESQVARGLKPNSSAGAASCGKTATRGRGDKVYTKLPENQTVEEWLDDYGRVELRLDEV